MKEGFYIAEINFLLALPCHQCSKPFGVQIRTAASKVLFCVVLMNIYCVEQLKEMSLAEVSSTAQASGIPPNVMLPIQVLDCF